MNPVTAVMQTVMTEPCLRQVVRAFRFFFSSRRRHTRFDCDWSSDVCSSDLSGEGRVETRPIFCSSSANPLIGCSLTTSRKSALFQPGLLRFGFCTDDLGDGAPLVGAIKRKRLARRVGPKYKPECKIRKPR